MSYLQGQDKLDHVQNCSAVRPNNHYLGKPIFFVYGVWPITSLGCIWSRELWAIMIGQETRKDWTK